MKRRKSGTFAAVLFAVAWLVMVAGIVIVRWELLPLSAGLLLSVGAALVLLLYGVLLLPVILFKLLGRRPVASSTLSYCLFGLLPAGAFLFTVGAEGLKAPAIHDISTDTGNPPAFELAAEARSEGDNPAGYEGAVIARIQEDAYPDIQPVTVPAGSAEVMAAARQVAEEMGWEILGIRSDGQVMEAVDRSLIFGFEDDIAVRVTPLENGASRVDVRSASRVGLGDLGANARRIRAFQSALAARLGK